VDIKISDRFTVKVKHHSKSKTTLVGLFYEHELITLDWTEIIDFMEIFQAYLKNYLTVGEEYPFLSHMTIVLAKHQGKVALEIYTQSSREIFTKLDAGRLVHKLNRILSRCDLLYHE
jgi:hypothetical protein